MNIRPQLEKKIESKKQEILELDVKLREANAFLLGLQEALRMLPREGNGNERVPNQILRPSSNMAKARDYLQRTGKPMHITEILKGMGVVVDKKNKVSFSGSLGTYARKGIIFTRPGANIFGLIEFGDAKIHHPESNPGSFDEFNSEPPEDFGMEEDSGEMRE